MKKQNYLLHRATIAFAFLTACLTMAGCEGNSQGKNSAASQAKIKPPQVDIHTAILTNNMEALK